MRSMLESFRNEMLWSPDESFKLQNAYGIARNIGDRFLNDSEGSSPEVRSLLERSRPHARPATYELGHMHESGANIAGGYNEKERKIEAYYAGLNKQVASIRSKFEKQGISLLDPSDALLFSMLATVSHEAGHALLGGVGGLAIENGGIHKGTRLLATRQYLAGHPEDAITGHWLTDVRTHEERFAEGYGHIVVSEAAAALGYDETARDVLLKSLAEDTGIATRPLGQHAVDLLGEVTAEKGIKDVALEKGYLMGDEDLGYSMPLTPQEVFNQLHALGSEMNAGVINEASFKIDKEQWAAEVAARQSETTKAVITAQRNSRPLAQML